MDGGCWQDQSESVESWVGSPNKTILLKTVLTTEKVLYRIDDLHVGKLMLGKGMKFQGMHMSESYVSRKGNREHDFGDHSCIHYYTQ